MSRFLFFHHQCSSSKRINVFILHCERPTFNLLVLFSLLFIWHVTGRASRLLSDGWIFTAAALNRLVHGARRDEEPRRGQRSQCSTVKGFTTTSTTARQRAARQHIASARWFKKKKVLISGLFIHLIDKTNINNVHKRTKQKATLGPSTTTECLVQRYEKLAWKKSNPSVLLANQQCLQFP